MRTLKPIVTFIIILVSVFGFSQEQHHAVGKVGLVLSGGGAKGMAHVGVLKVIDSLGVKVDYVAGTSMGAVVGALYASGYSGKALDSIFKVVDFDNVISDNLPRASKTFYERNNSEKYAVILPFDKFKVKLPSALSRGQNTYNLLSKLTTHLKEIKSFDEMPIPFFCIATNIETGGKVVLEKGNLVKAVMASSALPSLFQPVIINDQILIDGGVVNNYPIDELRAKGMDVIIGVDVQDGLMNRDELTSAPDLLLQINNFRTIKDMKLKFDKTDIYIKPDIEDYNVVSFNDASTIIEKGKEAGLAKIEDLKRLVVNRPTKNQSQKTRIMIPDSINISRIYVEGFKKYTRSYILGKLKLKNNKKVSYEKLNSGINNLMATDNFESFEYELQKHKTKPGYNLLTRVKESKITTFLKMGVHFDDLYKSGLLINLTKKHLFFDNDIASLDVVLGDNVRYNFEYFIDKGFYWSIGLRSRLDFFHKNISAELLLEDSEIITTGLNKIDAELQDQTNQLYVQTLFRKDFALSIGAEHKRLEIESETLSNTTSDDEDFAFEKTDYFSVFGNLKLDTYDDKYFPKKGLYFNGDIHYFLFASMFNEDFDRFSIAKAELGYAFSISNKLAFNVSTSSGVKIGPDSTKTLDFALGGYGNNLINNFIPFLGYDFISLTGNSFVKAYAGADYEIFKNNHITLEANWANVDDDIFQTSEWLSLPDYRGYALGYALDTFLGPIQAKYSYSPERGRGIWFFNVGFWF